MRSDEMLTGLMSVSLFYRYFRNLLWNKKSLTSEKNELSCQMLYCACDATLYITSLKRRKYEHATREIKLQYQ